MNQNINFTRTKLKVLKFDDCYPENYIEIKQNQFRDKIQEMDFILYYSWLMGLRSYLSDFFTHAMIENGWEAMEFVVRDPIYIEKYKQYLSIKKTDEIKFTINLILNSKLNELINYISKPKKFISKYSKEKYYWYVDKIIEHYNPDVIFIREPIIFDGQFWEKYRGKKFISTIIGANTKFCINWNEHRNNLIFTLTEEFYNYYKTMNIPIAYCDYGIDQRIFNELKDLPKIYDVTFVGLLGTNEQSNKTKLMAHLAKNINFKWWGIKGDLSNYPELQETWQGETSGIDMYKIYRQSKIVVNDYVNTANGKNVNMRTKEVLSVGTFLLTRFS